MTIYIIFLCKGNRKKRKRARETKSVFQPRTDVDE
jgi:hypothetical protein